MAEVVEVKVRQICLCTGPIKGMLHVVIASSLRVVEDPRHIMASVEAREEAPEGFVERQGPRLSVFRLREADKAMRHVYTIPHEPQQLPFPHAGMNGRKHEWPEPVLTSLEQPLRFGFPCGSSGYSGKG